MCGRFTNAITWRELVELYQIHDQPALNLAPRYNIAPGQDIPLCRLAPDREPFRREIVQARWGLVPFWAKDEKIGYKTINARAETVHEKPSFRAAFRKRRCLIPADGFYEWKKLEDGSKQPYRICLADGGAFSFAGLWEYNKALDLASCTIIVTKPNPVIAEIHDRMPVILAPENYDTWLSPDTDPAEVTALLRPYAGQMTAYPVSKAVGSARNDDPGLIEPVEQTT